MWIDKRAYRSGFVDSVCHWDNPLALVSDAVGKPLSNLLLGVRGYWQPSGKFLRGYWELLLIAHICQRVANTTDPPGQNLPEGTDYSPEQLAESTGKSYGHLQEGWPVNSTYMAPIVQQKIYYIHLLTFLGAF